MGIGLGDVIALIILAGLGLSIIAGMIYATILLVKKLMGPRPEDS